MFCVFSISACSSPIGPIAGGALEGTSKPWPQDWSFATDCENVLLQTDSADPYSVTVWGVSIDQYFYVASSDQGNQWAINLRRDPNVVLRIKDDLYSGVATVVTDPIEAQQVLEQYSLKYDFYVDESDDAEGVIYRLTRTPE